MPYEIKLDNPPLGYALSSVEKNKKLKVSSREFISSEDGDLFISRLEGIPNQIIAQLPPNANIKASTIDHLLAIINKDGSTTVYVNEIKFTLLSRVSNAVKAGQPVYEDDLLDIQELSFGDIQIPTDSGFVFIFSLGWKKALYYDFELFLKSDSNREYNINKTLGHFYTYLMFQNLFKITTEEWKLLFNQRWFPFIGLKISTTKKILNLVRDGISIDMVLKEINSEINLSVDTMLLRWDKCDLFIEHIDFLRNSVERYKANDFISCVSILYPRIEGIMRTLHLKVAGDKKATQNSLVDSLGKNNKDNISRLLPHKFLEYIKEIFFENFNQGEPASLSRNSISHGVASSNDFSLKSATAALLIIDQIYYHIPPK